ncbi:hypothetical protein N9B45_02370 [bacterium]|nr:hypothetical protein [bacterium]
MLDRASNDYWPCFSLGTQEFPKTMIYTLDVYLLSITSYLPTITSNEDNCLES